MLEPIQPPQANNALQPIQTPQTLQNVEQEQYVEPVMAYMEKPSPRTLFITLGAFLFSVVILFAYPLIRGDGTVIRLNMAYNQTITQVAIIAFGLFILTITASSSYFIGRIQSKKAYTEEQIVYIRSRPKVFKWLVFAILGGVASVSFTLLEAITGSSFFGGLLALSTLATNIILLVFVVQAVRHLLSYIHQDVRFAAKHITKQAGLAAANKFIKK